MIRVHQLQRTFDLRGDVLGRGVIVLYARVRERIARHDDVRLGNQFDFIAQRRAFQSAAEQLFRFVETVNVGLVDGCDALLEACFDLGMDVFGR